MVASQSPVCQICAMPMTKPGDSALILMALNTMHKGEFTALDLTIKDMADSNPNMMIKEFNIPEDQAKAAAMDGLVRLKRWQ